MARRNSSANKLSRNPNTRKPTLIQQNGFASGTQRSNLRPHAATSFDVEPGSGLVQK
jgi:hypothetical protein